MLLDYELKKTKINPSDIRGYNREEFTHTGVAASVASGISDVGLGILAAARALDMDFIPILKERYDLIIPSEYYGTDLLTPLIGIIKEKDFKNQVIALGGYDISQTGQVITRIPQ